jgi:hypothetical protein
MRFSLSPTYLIHLYNKEAQKPSRMKETFNPDSFVAKWYCSKVGPEDMPLFAADALEAGYDGPALRRLAGLIRPTSRDVGDLFRDALREIGKVKIQSKEQAVFSLSRETAADILQGRVDPVRGAEILARYAAMVGYPESLAEFLQLSEMPHWGDYAPNKQQLTQDILAQARELLDHLPG